MQEEENDKYYYENGIMEMNIFTVSYPESEKEKYDSMVEHIYNTFRAQGISEFY